MKHLNLNSGMGENLNLAGKTAVITGGAVNIGKAVSTRLSTLGVKTVIVYNHSAAEAVELSKEINFSGGTSAAFQADISDEFQVEALFKSISQDDRFGRVDILVNNSGVFSLSEQIDLPASEWQRLFNINVMGTFLCSREAAKLMKMQPVLEDGNCRGSIVNIASINAVHPGFGKTVHYDATKGAVLSFTKSLAAELGPEGIRVNAVAPGLVDSATLRKDSAPLAEMVETRNPLASPDGTSRLVETGDIADTVVFLVSNLSTSITGEMITVDRGYLLT